MTKPNISKIAFWDVNFDKIDFDESSVFVIDKVINHGTWAESFLCLILELNKTDFTAYQRRQARVSNWTY